MQFMISYLDIFNQAHGHLKQNEPLSSYTSWRVGGPADYLYQPRDLSDLSYVLKHLPLSIPLYYLGAGTNVLVRDRGVRGVVLLMKNALTRLELIHLDEKEGLIYAGAGISVAQLSHFVLNHDLGGFEFLSGIPGTVGGALAMNAGAYGSEIWKFVVKVDTINRYGEIHERLANEYQVGYRSVVMPCESEWFVGGIFRLVKGNRENSMQMMQDMLNRRKATQPLHLPNAGSVFCNPPQQYAARLIEQCGLKGFRKGGASVSTQHANFIVNDQEAVAADIEELIFHIVETVQRQMGISLKTEVRILGE
jgi:UDP-N-acetylmuramate dehydrogenase